MSAHILVTCSICDQPMRVDRNYQGVRNENTERAMVAHHALALTFGYSLGGWGYRRDWLNFSSGEVCNDCFHTIEEMLKPIVAFVRDGGGRQSDPVPPVRTDELAPEGRGRALLRSVRRLGHG